MSWNEGFVVRVPINHITCKGSREKTRVGLIGGREEMAFSSRGSMSDFYLLRRESSFVTSTLVNIGYFAQPTPPRSPLQEEIVSVSSLLVNTLLHYVSWAVGDLVIYPLDSSFRVGWLLPPPPPTFHRSGHYCSLSETRWRLWGIWIPGELNHCKSFI